MRLTINGTAKEFSDVTTIEGLMAALKLDARKVAVEKNLEIVPRSTYAQTALKEGDTLEIITFIGGG